MISDAREGNWLPMYVLAGIAGFAIGFAVWFIASYGIAASIAWVEDRRPELVGSRQLRAAEAVACGLLFLGCLALAFWSGWLIWIGMK